MKFDKSKKWILGIAIALIFTLFSHQGLNTFYESPNYEDYCDIQPVKLGDREIPQPEQIQEDQECRGNYQNARDIFEKKAFILLIVSGAVALIIGLLLTIESLSYGLLIGGLLNIFFGTVRYWSRLGDPLRFILLGIILVILVYIAYKKTQ
tara:strand:- start:206 stop:658 length:453 start_codon:yes stop_codon:yes gene_type:complete